MADFRVTNGGSMFLVHPLTQECRDWLDENVQAESWQWLGNALAVEHRFIEDLVEGMQNDGLNAEE